MIAVLSFKNLEWHFDLAQPLDISVAFSAEQGVRAWDASSPIIHPVTHKDWIGDVNQGASVNYYSIFLLPHSQGTHTESIGHINQTHTSVDELIKGKLFLAELISIEPLFMDTDRVINRDQIEKKRKYTAAEALVIRSLPNGKNKLYTDYSGTNPPYFSEDAGQYLASSLVHHLLTDLPSVDKEQDHGALAAHKAFWGFPKKPRNHATITELIYVPDEIADGLYLLNLQLAPIVNDAVPSRPILYPLIKVI